MISLYIIAGFFLALGALELTTLTDDPCKSDKLGRSGLLCAFFGALILAFTEWARSAGVF